jgi:hypothetical protein
MAATRRGQFYTLDADRLNRHGPRLADSALRAATEHDVVERFSAFAFRSHTETTSHRSSALKFLTMFGPQ